MQALKNASPDLQIKDKFLVQTTIVPFGTADEDIVPAFVSMQQFVLGLFDVALHISLYF
jgi:hypothetical protein